MSIPPVLAPTLKTSPNPKPIHNPAYRVDNKASLVIVDKAGTRSKIAKKLDIKMYLTRFQLQTFYQSKNNQQQTLQYLLHTQYRKYLFLSMI